MEVSARHIISFGDTRISIYPGYTVTRFHDGAELVARHDDVAGLGQAQTAHELGYPSVAALNQDHDLTHQLLARWLGHPYSPTLWAQAHGQVYPGWWREEAAVLAIQALAQAQGVDLIARARAYCASQARKGERHGHHADNDLPVQL